MIEERYIGVPAPYVKHTPCILDEPDADHNLKRDLHI